MRIGIATILGLALAGAVPSARALDGPEVTHVNGTIHAIPEGATGTFDSSSESILVMHFGPEQISIPYTQIKSVVYREENKFRLGVLATIAVGLVKARTKNHFVTLVWKDVDGVQVIKLEAPKQRAVGLLETIRARAPQACRVRLGDNSACVMPE